MVRDRTPLQLGSPAPSSLGSAPASRGLVSSLHITHFVRQLETTTRYFNFIFQVLFCLLLRTDLELRHGGEDEHDDGGHQEEGAHDDQHLGTVQYSTVQYSTVQLLTLAAREESGSSVRRQSRVRSWAQHMPCRYILVFGDWSATACGAAPP